MTRRRRQLTTSLVLGRAAAWLLLTDEAQTGVQSSALIGRDPTVLQATPSRVIPVSEATNVGRCRNHMVDGDPLPHDLLRRRKCIGPWFWVSDMVCFDRSEGAGSSWWREVDVRGAPPAEPRRMTLTDRVWPTGRCPERRVVPCCRRTTVGSSLSSPRDLAPDNVEQSSSGQEYEGGVLRRGAGGCVAAGNRSTRRRNDPPSSSLRLSVRRSQPRPCTSVVGPSSDVGGVIAVVVIGRNEGDRLVRCLESLHHDDVSVVYVDSGSVDDSTAAARGFGARVVELDMSTPFTAARARNAGYQVLRDETNSDYVQFLDGDCALQRGWLQAAVSMLSDHPDVGIVTGWLSEIHRDRSIYNRMCDTEWRGPAGDIDASGGNMMVRRAALDAVGGFDPTVISAEDDELCIRIRAAGWRVYRLPVELAVHDAAMTRFVEWWRRAVRAGHGFAQVGAMHPGYFAASRRRAWFYGAVVPGVALVTLLLRSWLFLVVPAIYTISFIRTARGLVGGRVSRREAAHHAAYLVLSKFPTLQGILKFHWRRRQGKTMKIIEYK